MSNKAEQRSETEVATFTGYDLSVEPVRAVETTYSFAGGIIGIEEIAQKPRWRPDAPPSRILYASNGSMNVILETMGPIVDEAEVDVDLYAWLAEAQGDAPGVWVIEVTFQWVAHETPDGREWDIELEFGSQRPATDEEMTSLQNEEYPWDPSIWAIPDEEEETPVDAIEKDEAKTLNVYRVEVMVIDHDEVGPEGVKAAIENARYPNRCIHPEVMGIETRQVDWHEQHPLNLNTQMKDAFRKLFA